MNKIAIIWSEFNLEVTQKLMEGARDELLKNKNCQIEIFKVPGAVEIPLACHWAFEAGFHGVVAVGAVIKGETDHYHHVCRSVERGVTETMLKWNRPIGFGVLTTETEEQALERAGGRHGNKGAEAAVACLDMLKLKQTILISIQAKGS